MTARPSARERIANLWSRGFSVDPLLDAMEAEVLRKLRRSILAASLAGPTDPNAGETWTAGYKAGLSVAADLATCASKRGQQ